MYFKYKVKWFDTDENETITETGLIYTVQEDDYARACEKIMESFDNIEFVSLVPFAPDGCLEVSEKALEAIKENVIW